MLLAGAVPSGLRGSLFRVGPAMVHRRGAPPAHVFDGDGRVDKVTFLNGSVTTLSRVLETPAYLAEQACDEFVHRGAFGTSPHKSLRTLKNPANTSLFWHANELLACWEGGVASRVNPDTLAYMGPHTMGGVATNRSPFSVQPALDSALNLGGDAVCAHPVRDPASGRLAVLLSRYSTFDTTLRFVEFHASSWTVCRDRTLVVDGFTHVHSFALTPTDYVFFQPPLRMDFASFRSGASVLDAIRQAPGPTRLVRLPRAPGAPARSHAVERCYATHVVSASAHHVDYFRSDELGRTMSLHFSPARSTFADRGGGWAKTAALDDSMGEFPATHPGTPTKNHMFYSGSSQPGSSMDCWVKLDTATGVKRFTAPTGGVRLTHLEPVFVPRSNSADDDGWLVGFVLDGRHNLVKVVDAQTMVTACLLRTTGLNVSGLHGVWVG